jgi:hypothetical protein
MANGITDLSMRTHTLLKLNLEFGVGKSYLINKWRSEYIMSDSAIGEIFLKRKSVQPLLDAVLDEIHLLSGDYALETADGMIRLIQRGDTDTLQALKAEWFAWSQQQIGKIDIYIRAGHNREEKVQHTDDPQGV